MLCYVTSLGTSGFWGN